ncbi:hypothetical protein O181_004661 [Austropuccinia psidii MF-1]|uniref:Reverse transcriptase Ty1/copia-type domain-containing protein n=1 Tax=Austropuccinia psidii MF-1 TaxID=1389203 RepID=A0A9Q3BHC7_9BASI|nr:hypothetical protein [Austropuccinia psidii MF-1]
MSLRLMLAMAVLNGWQMVSFDVSGAYLYSPVDECVLMEPPTYFMPELRSKVLSLKKALYGMRQVVFVHLLQQDCGDCHLDTRQQWFYYLNLSECYFGFQGGARLTAGYQMVGQLGPDMDTTPFRLVIGSLAYLVSSTLGLVGPRGRLPAQNSRPGNISLSLWSNAGWGGDLERSQTGFVLKLGTTPILWGSKRQSVVVLSTCAAEYITLSDSTQHLVQAINQLGQLVGDFDKAIFCDNQATVQVLIDNKLRKQMRYLDQAFFFVNDMVCKHGIKIMWVKTDDMLADALTKRLLGPTLL